VRALVVVLLLLLLLLLVVVVLEPAVLASVQEWERELALALATGQSDRAQKMGVFGSKTGCGTQERGARVRNGVG